jgi:ketosteroid isomerase-like protein
MMRARRITIAVTLIVAVSPVSRAGAQKPTVQNSAEAIEARTLLKLEDDWCKGLVNRDAAMFRKLMAPGFIYTENAKVFSRDSVIKSVLSGDKVERAVNQYMQVHEFGPAAVVTGVLAVTSRGKTGAYTTRYRFTDTWLNSGGTWQIIAAQDYVIPDRSGQ